MFAPQLLLLAFEAKENLQNLGVFRDVDLFIDTSAGNVLFITLLR